MSNTIQFPIKARQIDGFVRTWRSSLAEGMANERVGGDRIRRALDALEPDIRLLGELLVVDVMPETVLEYQIAVMEKAGKILKEKLVAILEGVNTR